MSRPVSSSEDASPRVVIVTGASSGIGRETARALARRGDRVLLAARRRRELERAAEECRHLGAAAAGVMVADVSDAAQVEAAFASAEARWGEVDAVVHAAGVAAYGRFVDIPADVFDRVQQVNVLGTANVARSALRRFERHGRGDLVLLGSIVGMTTAPFFTPYVTSKWAVRGLGRTLQAEAGHRDIHVSLVEPGGVQTSIYEKAASYLGVQGRPPPPVDEAARVAEAVVEVLGSPRREEIVGRMSPVLRFAFDLAPGLYDRLAPPMMRRFALASAEVAPHTGNLFSPVPEPSIRSSQEETMPGVNGQTPVMSRHMDVPPEQVWRVLADGWVYPSWVVGTSRMRDVDPEWPAAGSRLHHSVGVWPLLLNDKTEVVEVEPQRRLRLKAHGWPAGTAEVVIDLKPEGTGTSVEIREDAWTGPAVAIPAPLRHLAVKPRNREALRRLSFLVHGRSR